MTVQMLPHHILFPTTISLTTTIPIIVTTIFDPPG
jgi:hypothetical protein